MSSDSTLELWGYPGAGKTSIAAFLCSNLDIQVTRAWSFKASLARQPLKTLQLAMRRPFVTGHLPGPDLYERRALSRLWLRQRCTAEALPRPVLFEEGLVNGLWRALYRNPTFSDAAWWNMFIPLIRGTVIVLGVTPAVSLSRIKQKQQMGAINFELLSSPLEGERWERAEHAYETLLARLKASRVKLIEIDSNKSTIEQKSRLVLDMFKIQRPPCQGLGN